MVGNASGSLRLACLSVCLCVCYLSTLSSRPSRWPRQIAFIKTSKKTSYCSSPLTGLRFLPATGAVSSSPINYQYLGPLHLSLCSHALPAPFSSPSIYYFFSYSLSPLFNFALPSRFTVLHFYCFVIYWSISLFFRFPPAFVCIVCILCSFNYFHFSFYLASKYIQRLTFTIQFFFLYSCDF